MNCVQHTYTHTYICDVKIKRVCVVCKENASMRVLFIISHRENKKR